MLTAIGDVMREAYKRNWITTRDGNISLRRGKSFYITPSGWRKTIIHPEHLLKATILENNELEFINHSNMKPSGELEMHRLLQVTDFSETRSVVHLHPTHIVAAMHKGFDLQEIAKEFPEVFRYTMVGPSVAKLPATSKELADSTLNALTADGLLRYSIVGQKNHGVCSVAKNPWDAFEHIERLDHICKIILASGVNP